MAYLHGVYESLEAILGDPEDWMYVGGDRKSHAKRYFKVYGDNAKFPPHETHCLCGHRIEENCYIAEKLSKENIQVLGNCCIKRFLPTREERKLCCNLCLEPHQNKRHNLCNECGHCPHGVWVDQCAACHMDDLSVGQCSGCDKPTFVQRLNEDGECTACVNLHTKNCEKCKKEVFCRFLNGNGECVDCVTAYNNCLIRCKSCKTYAPRYQMDKLQMCRECHWSETETKSGDAKWYLRNCEYGWSSKTGELWAKLGRDNFIDNSKFPPKAKSIGNVTKVAAHVDIRKKLLEMEKACHHELQGDEARAEGTGTAEAR